MLEQPAAPTAPIGGDAADRILTAAEALFAEHGYDAVSMTAVAALAGVSKANIFHHFTSKNELYIAVLRAACKNSIDNLHQLESDPRPLAERLTQFAQEHLNDILQHHQVSRLILRELLQNGTSRGQELADQVFGDKFQWFVRILRAGQASGELRADTDPAMIATLLIGANVFYFESREVLRHFPDMQSALDPERYTRQLVDILLRGILPATPRPSGSG
jgi:TetR/AcrR family transcriptional regulator